MAEEPKKISFGFTKINKKAVLSLPKKEEKEIQFIACLEENSIKLLNGEDKEKELPIIPLRNGNILRDNMIEALKARKEKKKTVSDTDDVKIENSKDEDTKPLTLDELAAKEILEDLKKVNETEEVQETLTIPQVEAVKVSEKESTLEDYDNMPVNQFGLAVLRGMGWQPDKGVGKNAKVVEPINPVLRPKGMGLGADKVIQTVKTESKEELIMKKGAFIKVISGQNKGLYGKVEGFNDLPGRIIVRLTLRNDVISISENLVTLVTSSEYNKNSKILNIKEYDEFVEKKPLPVSSQKKEKAPERDFKKDSSPEDDRKSKREHKKYDSYRNRDRKRSDDISESRHRKYKYTRDKRDSSEADRSRKYDKDSVESESSDSTSSDDRKKSKSKKHRKHSSKHRSRSRSRNRTHKKKKKRNHRSRS
nr:G-patch domain and KOW motifs-containing protein isoform X2 [Halyomorpha halys]